MPDTHEKAIVFPGTDSFQQTCGLIQDQAESLLESTTGKEQQMKD
jgi:hypothetical protein